MSDAQSRTTPPHVAPLTAPPEPVALARALAETAPDAIITIDEASTILFANAAAERLFGYSASELVGQPLHSLMPERMRAAHTAGMARYLATHVRNIPWQGVRLPIRTSAGLEVTAEIAFGEFTADGRRLFSGFLRDISERVESERALDHAHTQLQDQALELELTNQQLQDNAVELEAANEELEATAAALEDRTEEAERARAEADTATDRAQRLQRLTARLNQATSAEEIADAVFNGGLDAVGADAGSLAMVRADDGGAPREFEIVRTTGFGDAVSQRYHNFPVTPGRPLSDAVLHRRLALLSSPQQWSAQFPAAAEDLAGLGFQAFAAVPVIAGDRVRAALSFSFLRARDFDDATATFLTTLGEQCALALERQRAHAAELRQTAEHAALLETIQDPFVALDRELRYAYVNPAAESLLRRPAAELLGRRADALFSDGPDSPLLAAARRVLETGESVQVEASLGTGALHRWLDARVHPAPHGVALVLRDMTERRRAQDAATFMAEASRLLSASLEYEQTLAALARSAVPVLGDWCAVDMLVDPTSSVWPPAVRRIAVMHKDPARIEWARELERRLPQDWSSPTGLARVLREGVTEFIPVLTEEIIVAAAQTAEQLAVIRELDFHAYLCVPLVSRGRTLGALTLCMTESGRHYDEADRALAEELARRAATAVDNALLYGDAERARLAAEAANRAKTEFLSTMSHELRTPLNAIGGYAELLSLGLRGPVTDAQREDLSRLTRANQHLIGLIGDVLNFARVERSQVEYHVTQFALGSVAADAEALVLPQVAAKGLVFARGGHTDEPAGTQHMVTADAEKARQVILNLLTNAIKFTAPGGRITLSCETDSADDVVRLRVADTGRGIPVGQMDRIFEPFVQVDRHLTHDSQQGVGLGLAISRELARGMGGDLSVQSAPGEGSTFTLTLPAAR